MADASESSGPAAADVAEAPATPELARDTANALQSHLEKCQDGHKSCGTCLFAAGLEVQKIPQDKIFSCLGCPCQECN